MAAIKIDCYPFMLSWLRNEAFIWLLFNQKSYLYHEKSHIHVVEFHISIWASINISKSLLQLKPEYAYTSLLTIHTIAYRCFSWRYLINNLHIVCIYCAHSLETPVQLSLFCFCKLLSENHISGSLPEELGYLPNLANFQLDLNDISGPIPKSFANLTKVAHSWVLSRI